MLPPFIIEQIRQRERREQQQREERQQPRLELPLDRFPVRRPAAEQQDDDEPNRGVVILDLG